MTAGLPNYMKAEVIGRFQAFIEEYNILINGVWAFFMMSSVLIFIIHFIRLAHWSGNAYGLYRVKKDLLITAICTALFGSFGLVFFLITRMFL